MDPNATVDLINECLARFDFYTAQTHWGDLAEWLAKGGFAPTEPILFPGVRGGFVQLRVASGAPKMRA